MTYKPQLSDPCTVFTPPFLPFRLVLFPFRRFWGRRAWSGCWEFLSILPFLLESPPWLLFPLSDQWRRRQQSCFPERKFPVISRILFPLTVSLQVRSSDFGRQSALITICAPLLTRKSFRVSPFLPMIRPQIFFGIIKVIEIGTSLFDAP